MFAGKYRHQRRTKYIEDTRTELSSSEEEVYRALAQAITDLLPESHHPASSAVDDDDLPSSLSGHMQDDQENDEDELPQDNGSICLTCEDDDQGYQSDNDDELDNLDDRDDSDDETYRYNRNRQPPRKRRRLSANATADSPPPPSNEPAPSTMINTNDNDTASPPPTSSVPTFVTPPPLMLSSRKRKRPDPTKQAMRMKGLNNASIISIDRVAHVVGALTNLRIAQSPLRTEDFFYRVRMAYEDILQRIEAEQQIVDNELLEGADILAHMNQ